MPGSHMGPSPGTRKDTEARSERYRSKDISPQALCRQTLSRPTTNLLSPY